MATLKTTLRERFYCETDIKVEATSEDRKAYATWLEALAVSRLNAEAIAKNDLLRDVISKAVDALDEAVTCRVVG
ncbi:MAG: hypothetical protein AAB066_00845 [Candidatus Margulisiibacteriota bacterium]